MTMQHPLELAFINVEPSDQIKALVDEKTKQLEVFCDSITSCTVHIRAPHKRHRQGNLYEVTIEVHVPGDDLVVRHGHTADGAGEHLAVAVRDAFAAMARQLKRWREKAAGEVKIHEGMLQGKVVEINHDGGYGQIIANDHRLIYFHRNSVVGGNFDDLKPRDPVELVVQTDESGIGPQASTVRPIGSLRYDPKTKNAF